MNNILIYCRNKKTDPIAEQTACILSEQLEQLGLHAEISHALNFPRLLLNSYQTVHFIVEELPLNINEMFYFSVCKALGKSTVLSVLNSEIKARKSFFDFIGPDAFSVSQTNHLKLYRNLAGKKFIFPAFPKSIGSTKKSCFSSEAFLIPLQSKIEEVFDYKIKGPIYFDGRNLLKAQGSSKNSSQKSSQLRKKWNDFIISGKITSEHHLILSESKLVQLINEESLAVVLADPGIKNTEFTEWLNIAINKNNLIILNDYQATGFSGYWTSGCNCLIISSQNWKDQLNLIPSPLKNLANLQPTTYVSSELFESSINELSRLYAKLWQQKTSLLTTKSVKL